MASEINQEVYRISCRWLIMRHCRFTNLEQSIANHSTSVKTLTTFKHRRITFLFEIYINRN